MVRGYVPVVYQNLLQKIHGLRKNRHFVMGFSTPGHQASVMGVADPGPEVVGEIGYYYS